MSDDCTPSRIIVNVKSSVKADYTLLLVVPSVQAMVEGGLLENGVQYGFYEADGSIPLPLGQKCYVIAFAEADGKLIFAKKQFSAKQSQILDLEFVETTKEGLHKQIKDLKLDDVSSEVSDTKNATQIKVLDQQASEAEKLKPKNCNCGERATTADSTANK